MCPETVTFLLSTKTNYCITVKREKSRKIKSFIFCVLCKCLVIISIGIMITLTGVISVSDVFIYYCYKARKSKNFTKTVLTSIYIKESKNDL